jgi:hypothetical protein
VKATGVANGNWRGGRTVTSSGYVLVRVGKGHHLADLRGYAYEHRIVAEEKLGRRLQPGEQVHHVSGDKADNRPENLEVLTQVEHAVEHRSRTDLRMPDEENPTVLCECGCGHSFERFDGEGRPRRFVSGHNSGGARHV